MLPGGRRNFKNAVAVPTGLTGRLNTGSEKEHFFQDTCTGRQIVCTDPATLEDGRMGKAAYFKSIVENEGRYSSTSILMLLII